MAADLKKIRARIADLKLEIGRVKDSQRPVDQLATQLRVYLESLAAPYQRFVSLAAGVISHGVPINELVNHLPPSQLPGHAFGLALASIGVDTVVEQALAQAKAADTGALRMTVHERDDRLDELRRELYFSELHEESILDGAERRPDANSACVIGIPLAVALEIDEQNQNHYLLSGKW